MKLLCFQAKRFRWKTHSKTLPEVVDRDVEEEVRDAIVVFIHAERSDEDEARRDSVLRQSLKHIKWLANKRALKNIVIHSFTHLGGETASPSFAECFITLWPRLLADPAYQLWVTPLGYFGVWDLRLFGGA